MTSNTERTRCRCECLRAGTRFKIGLHLSGNSNLTFPRVTFTPFLLFARIGYNPISREPLLLRAMWSRPTTTWAQLRSIALHSNGRVGRPTLVLSSQGKCKMRSPRAHASISNLRARQLCAVAKQIAFSVGLLPRWGGKSEQTSQPATQKGRKNAQAKAAFVRSLFFIARGSPPTAGESGRLRGR